MVKSGKITKPAKPPEKLQGWKAIAEYLGIGTATAQHWAKTGMPVKREGRFMVADPEELRAWLGEEAHLPAPAAVLAPGAERTDITAALKESITVLRRNKRQR
jgi:hypothetical protein